jgi:Protein of unknown function (DUF1634)
MNDERVDETRRLERLLARQMRYGVWLASGVTALGTIVTVFGRCTAEHGPTMTLGTSIVRTGIVLIILLPILRVVVMMTVFLRQRDYLIGMIAGIVLATIGVGFVAGLCVLGIH